VEALTGPIFVPSSQADFVIEARVGKTEAGFEARVVTPGAAPSETGERVLNAAGADCHALDEALVFVLALAVDPALSEAALGANLSSFAEETPPEERLLSELEETPPRAAPGADAQETPEHTDEATVAETPEPAPERERAWHGSVAIGTSFSRWMLPASTWGAGAVAELQLRKRLRMRSTLRLFPRGPTHALGEGGGALELSAYQTLLQLCVGLGRLPLAVCGGPELSYLRGRGQGFVRNYTGALWVPALSASLTAVLPLWGRLGVMADLAGRIGLTSPAFFSNLGGVSERYQPGRWGLALLLGPTLDF
jgi:hypothetical protein